METITRSSKHVLKFATKQKQELLERMFFDYKLQLQLYIDFIWEEALPLKTFLSSNELPDGFFKYSAWKQICWRQAYQICKEQLKRNHKSRFKRYKKIYSICKNKRKWHKKFLGKKFSELNLKKFCGKKPDVKNFSINVDTKGYKDIKDVGGEFDQFIQLIVPFKKRINIPVKQHAHSLKYKSWNRLKTFQLKEINNNFYVTFLYEKEKPKVKPEGKHLGIDVGINKLFVDSDGNKYGENLKLLIKEILNKKQYSNRWKKKNEEIKNYIRENVNKLPYEMLNLIVKEDLKGIQQKTKQNKTLNKETRRLLGYWHRLVFEQTLKQRCEENGVFLASIDPAFTSQICSNCGAKGSRNGERFDCKSCGLHDDADYNAAKNCLKKYRNEEDIHPHGKELLLEKEGMDAGEVESE